jgi:UDP-GlcNAc:undecaprenyl-phosphate GlcNAc-1-phosphate transferase
MEWQVQGFNIFIILFVTFIASVILVPIVKKLAEHIGAIDVPNKRKVHKKPIPLMGGLAIFLAFMFGYVLFAEKTDQMNAILIGGFIIVLLGIFDDIKPIKARYKFIIQILAASVVVLHAQIYIPFVTAFGIRADFGIWGYPLAILFIVAVINAINLIDGLDGLAAGTSTIYFGAIFVIAFMLNKMGGLDIVLSLIMLGATLGFLVYNFYPAKIFMGDTGSMFLGYMISVTALLGFKGATLTSLLIPIMILLLPILDTLFAIFRRLLKGENIGAPDKEHVHHQLLKLNKSMRKTVLIMYGINFLCAAISIFYAVGDNQKAMFLYVGLLAVIFFLITRTDVLFKRSHR